MVELSFKRTQVRDAKYLMLGVSLIGPKVREVEALQVLKSLLFFLCSWHMSCIGR